MKEIEIVVGLDGKIAIDAIGFQGGECVDIVNKIAQAVGEIVESDKKPEYWEQEIEINSTVNN